MVAGQALIIRRSIMDLRFSKMHGLGNDYVYVDCTKEKLRHAEELARIVCQRRFGVGADGLILVCSSDKADFEVRIYGADGTEGRVCGNELCCAGKFVYDHGMTGSTELEIDTKNGIRRLRLTVADGKAALVEVDMGKASLRPKDIPVDTEYDDFISQPMVVGGEAYLVTGVSVDSPHAVTFCDEIDTLPLERVGPLFECNDKFPDGVSAEFVRVIDRNTLHLRVWERGRGETFACGTGACAAVVAAVVNGHCDCGSEVTVRFQEGQLRINYFEDGSVLMKGPATHVFDGRMEVSV